MIFCDCSCDDYDRANMFREQIRRARKQHTCCECGDPIEIGARHEYVFGVWGGHWDEHRTCLTCVAIRNHYCPRGYIYGELAEQIDNCLGFDYREVPEYDEEEEEEQ